MLKVLGLALYSPLAASTRYRLSQYVPGLASLGIDLRVRHLLDDEYLQKRFNDGGFCIRAIARGAFMRMLDLAGASQYDLLILYGELFPFVPDWLELSSLRRPYIYDFDDAFYLKYHTKRFSLKKYFLGQKFENIVRNAVAVTAGNKVLAEYSGRFNLNTSILPTVVDTNRYLPVSSVNRDGQFTIGWIGSPSTAPYLTQLINPLSKLGRESPVRLIVIGGSAPTIPNVQIREIRWEERTEIALLNQFDVGVMPLPNDSWARGKCAFKLIQYMACGIPVVASPVGANSDVVCPSSGFLADSEEEWLYALRRLRDDPNERYIMGKFGRERIVGNYSLQRNLPNLAEILIRAASK
jgi:glycosyltransferase involved in cell wall biosynthesis